MTGFFATEALRTAMRHFGNQPLAGAQVRGALGRRLRAGRLGKAGEDVTLKPTRDAVGVGDEGLYQVMGHMTVDPQSARQLGRTLDF